LFLQSGELGGSYVVRDYKSERHETNSGAAEIDVERKSRSSKKCPDVPTLQNGQFELI
jgi:hypothetical protein